MNAAHAAEQEDFRQSSAAAWAVLALALLTTLLATPIATSSAVFTSRSTNGGGITAAPDWTPPSVSLADPGGLRGIAALAATASDAETGIRDVAIAWKLVDATTWTTLCTRTSAPYTCSFDTSSLGEVDVDLRAVATDNAGYSSTALVEDVPIDNTAPTAALGTIATSLAGIVNIDATASDAGSGVASVAFQYAKAGTTTWTTACTDTVAPWSCRLDTTTIPDGTYDFRAVATDFAGNTATTASLRNRTINNTVASVSVDHPGSFIRGTTTITAAANSTVAIASVRIDRALVGSGTWTSICTDTTAPYSCSWNTTTVVDADYQLRAVLTDTSGKVTTSAVVNPIRVDNSAVRGFDVQATNGTTLGRIDAGDAVTLTYSRQMRTTSLLAGWDGTARAVTLRVRDGSVLGLGNTDDTLDVFTTTTLGTPVLVGSINLRGDYVRNGKTTTIAATMVHTTTTVNGFAASAVTLTVGTQPAAKPKDLRSTTLVPVMVWSPSSAAVDTNGVANSAAPATEQGTPDRDL